MFTAIKKFFEKRETKRIGKIIQRRFTEKYDSEQLKELYSQFSASAREILADVLVPYIEEQHKTYHGAKKIQVRISLWGDETYKITSQFDSYFHEYKYPNPGLDCHGVWQAALEMAHKFGLEGKALVEYEMLSIEYYFEKEVA